MMITWSWVCRDKISARPARADFTLRLHRGIKFHLDKAGQFSIRYLLRSSLGELMWLHRKISSWQSKIPVVQKGDPAMAWWNFSHVIVGYNLWRVYCTARIRAKQNRISSRPTKTMSPPQNQLPITTNQLINPNQKPITTSKNQLIYEKLWKKSTSKSYYGTKK